MGQVVIGGTGGTKVLLNGEKQKYKEITIEPMMSVDTKNYAASLQFGLTGYQSFQYPLGIGFIRKIDNNGTGAIILLKEVLSEDGYLYYDKEVIHLLNLTVDLSSENLYMHATLDMLYFFFSATDKKVTYKLNMRQDIQQRIPDIPVLSDKTHKIWHNDNSLFFYSNYNKIIKFDITTETYTEYTNLPEWSSGDQKERQYQIYIDSSNQTYLLYHRKYYYNGNPNDFKIYKLNGTTWTEVDSTELMPGKIVEYIKKVKSHSLEYLFNGKTHSGNSSYYFWSIQGDFMLMFSGDYTDNLNGLLSYNLKTGKTRILTTNGTSGSHGRITQSDYFIYVHTGGEIVVNSDTKFTQNFGENKILIGNIWPLKKFYDQENISFSGINYTHALYFQEYAGRLLILTAITEKHYQTNNPSVLSYANTSVYLSQYSPETNTISPTQYLIREKYQESYNERLGVSYNKYSFCFYKDLLFLANGAIRSNTYTREEFTIYNHNFVDREDVTTEFAYLRRQINLAFPDVNNEKKTISFFKYLDVLYIAIRNDTYNNTDGIRLYKTEDAIHFNLVTSNLSPDFWSFVFSTYETIMGSHFFKVHNNGTSKQIMVQELIPSNFENVTIETRATIQCTTYPAGSSVRTYDFDVDTNEIFRNNLVLLASDANNTDAALATGRSYLVVYTSWDNPVRIELNYKMAYLPSTNAVMIWKNTLYYGAARVYDLNQHEEFATNKYKVSKIKER